MAEQIKQLATYINKILAQESNPFFAVVDDKHRLLNASGKADYYGYRNLNKGKVMDDVFAFLIGLEDAQEESLKILNMETPSGKTANVHLLRLDDGGWGLAFLDATAERETQGGYQQTAHDLTLLGIKREKLLEKIKIIQTELEAANKELELANKLKSRFLGRLSHEFRAPLSSVLGYAELAKEDLGSPDRAMSHLKAIERGGNNLLNLVDNLVDQAVIENGMIKVHPAACDIATIVEEMEELFHPLADQKGLSFAWWVSGDIPTKVWLDKMRLRQILVNLLSNAFKFTREGGITVSMDWADNYLSVSVEDTGPGIKENDVNRLFEAFRQSTDEEHHGKGAGLGLSISREIVRHMGGDMEIAAPTGQGACVKFTVEAPPRREQGTLSRSLEDVSVLVVDNGDDSYQLLQVFLRNAGSVPQLADGASAALEMLKNNAPDLIVIDMQLGTNQVIKLIRDIKGQNYTGGMIVLSAVDDERQRQQVRLAGCVDYLVKPIRRTEFLQRLESVLADGGAPDSQS